MFRYLKAAFLVRPAIPGLGRMPVNAVAVASFGILGFGNPGFWLLGFALEAVFLTSLATNPRFQQLVRAEGDAKGESDAATKRQALAAQLDPAGQKKLTALENRCARALDLARSQGAEEYVLENNRQALDKLSWLYLRLLTARQFLGSAESETTERELRGQIAGLEREVADKTIAAPLRESKTATLKILGKRLENFERREQALEEIQSDLTRIEAQVDLAVENATIATHPQAVTSNISLVSQMLDPELFGASEGAIADLDQAYGEVRARQTQ